MLMLARQKGEDVIFDLPDGTTIRVVVARFSPQNVRLAIEAPKGVVIRRGELAPLEAEPCPA